MEGQDIIRALGNKGLKKVGCADYEYREEMGLCVMMAVFIYLMENVGLKIFVAFSAGL